MNASHYLAPKDELSGSVAGKDIRNARQTYRPRPQPVGEACGSRGFAAIELVAVIAILAILAVMLFPALSKGRERALTAQCLSNKRQLAMACQMYSAENNNYLVPNGPGPVVPQPTGFYYWCPGQVNWGTSTWNTNETAYRTNCLGRYLDNAKAYKCPADTIPSDNGDRIRSVSMNPSLVGNLPKSALDEMISMMGGWKLFQKMSDLGPIGASKIWIFCDESMYTLNDGYLQCNLKPVGAPGYPDVPAAYHGGGNCFSFADGHGEFRKWRYVTTDPHAGLLSIPYAKGVTGPGSGNSMNTSGLDPDWQWLRAHTSCPP